MTEILGKLRASELGCHRECKYFSPNSNMCLHPHNRYGHTNATYATPCIPGLRQQRDDRTKERDEAREQRDELRAVIERVREATKDEELSHKICRMVIADLLQAPRELTYDEKRWVKKVATRALLPTPATKGDADE